MMPTWRTLGAQRLLPPRQPNSSGWRPCHCQRALSSSCAASAAPAWACQPGSGSGCLRGTQSNFEPALSSNARLFNSGAHWMRYYEMALPGRKSIQLYRQALIPSCIAPNPAKRI